MSNGLMVIPTASHPAGRLRVSYVTAVGRADAGRVQLTDDRLFLTPPLPSVAGTSAGFWFGGQCSLAACKKGKVFPYSLPSVGPGADPGVQAVSPQVT